MKRLLPPLLALPLLLGACTSASQPAPGAPRPTPPPAIRTADTNTAWGERPTYDGKGQYFERVNWPNQRLYQLGGTPTLDLLVGRDGIVQKIAVIVSSGDAATDQQAAAMYWHARYSLPLGPDAAAPYVVRVTVDFRRFASARNRTSGSDDLSLNYNRFPTYTENNNAGNSNTVNGFVR